MKDSAPKPSQSPIPSPEEALANSEEKLAKIEQSIEHLRLRALKARQERETYVKEKIVDLETLTQKGDQIQQLQKSARKTLSKLEPFQSNPEIQGDSELARQLAAAQELMADLDRQAKEIADEIEKIGAQTEITSKIDEDDATERSELKLKHDADKTKAEYETKTKEEFAKDVEGFATELEKYTAELNAWYTENDRLKEESQRAHKEVEAVVKNALGMLGKERSPKKSRIQEAINYLGTKNTLLSKQNLEQAILELDNIRKSLGHWWGGDKLEKATIDFIVSKQHIFNAFQEAFAKANTKQGGERFTEEKSRLVKEFIRIQEKYSLAPVSLDLFSATDALYRDGRGKGKYTNPIYELTSIYDSVRYKRR